MVLDMNTLIGFAIVVLVIGGLIALFFNRPGNGNGRAYVPRFLFDSNKEAAEGAYAVRNPGYRRIVSASAAGDYHSEVARDAGVMKVEAMAEADSTAEICAMFERRRAERSRRSFTVEEEPKHEVIRVRRFPKPAEPVSASQEEEIKKLQTQVAEANKKASEDDKAKKAAEQKAADAEKKAAGAK